MSLEGSESFIAWNIPTQKSYGSLNGVMFNMNDVLVFPCMPNGRTSSIVGVRTEPLKMCLVKKESWLYGRFQRKLINESLDTFLSIQKAVGGNEKKTLRSILNKKSKEYRSMMQACVSEMNRLLEDLESGKPLPFKEDEDNLRTNCQLLYKLELVLGLIEIIFIDNQPGCILMKLLNWVRLHFPQCCQRMSEALSSDEPANYEYYWETCYGLILQGLLDEARDLLSRHPDSNFDSFLSMNELLRKMPVFNVYSGVSESEFSVRWLHWQRECDSRLRQGDFSRYKQLETICKILCGDLETFLSLADVLDTWYHLMTSYLLFTNPTVKLHRLSGAAQDAVLHFGGGISQLDRLLFAVLEADDHYVLKLCQSTLNNMWFTAHLSDLLFHSLDVQADKKYLQELRESLMCDYGIELVSHRSLWQIGLVYLDHSGASSQPLVAAVLERIPLSSDDQALKVIQAATDRGLDDVAMGVCRVMGRRMLNEGHLGAAVWWGVRSQDAAFTSHIAHKILHKYMEEGLFVSSSLLDHLGPSMLLSDTLTFLTKYREFHLLYQEGQIQKAASLLVSLIASRLAPEYFWPVLLEDALTLLQSPEPVISSEETYKLMYCLHNITEENADGKSARERKRKMYSSFFDKEIDVRLALTNNLARAIIHEGTTDECC